MILVDSSVWIDYFRGIATAQTGLLDILLERENVVIGDLILTEVLQGFRDESDFNVVRSWLLLRLWNWVAAKSPSRPPRIAALCASMA